jgi:hypothetical protein
MGDAAIAFGYASELPRAWYGTIVGHLGYNHTGKHFSPNAFENEKQLLFHGVQDAGMSGGAVINGNGYYLHILNIYYLILFYNVINLNKYILFCI